MSTPFLLPSFFDIRVLLGNAYIKDRAFSSSPSDNFLSELVFFISFAYINFYGFLHLKEFR